MASLIRSARIAAQHRLLGDGASPEKKSGEQPDKPSKQQPVANKSQVSWEADLRASSLARAELEEALRISQERTAQTEKELQRLLGDLDALRRDATEAGRVSGYQAGCDEGRAELNQHVKRLGDLIEQVSKAHETSLATAEEEIVEVVFASVAKILGETLVSADAVIAAVKQSTKQLVSRDRLVIHLSSDDKQLLEESMAGREDALFGTAVEIIADERIELGGCLLQTRTGGLDARLEVQMQQLRECLLKVAARRHAERSL
jgi:flagellar assembly protein FliH